MKSRGWFSCCGCCGEEEEEESAPLAV